MDIEIKLFSHYDRGQDAYVVHVGINSELYVYGRDVAMFSQLSTGEAVVSFATGGSHAEQRTVLPRTAKAKAAVAQATSIFAPQLKKAIQHEFGMSDALVGRLLAEKKLVVTGCRKDALMVVGAATAYRTDGIREAMIQHRFVIEADDGEVVSVSEWDDVGQISSIPESMETGAWVLASHELLAGGKQLLMARAYGRSDRSSEAKFYFTAADIGDSEKQPMVDGAELFAQVNLRWFFSYATSLMTSEDAKIALDYPICPLRTMR